MSWKKVRLIDVCDFQGGTQPPKNEWSSEKKDGYIRMLQIRDFTQGQEKHVEYVKLTNTLKTCNEDDILIGRYGASIGKILTGLRGAYNVAIVKTIPSEKLNKKYLYHYLCSPKFQNFIQNAGSRAAQAGFNKSELAELFINLPPTCTQEKIASILDKADELRRKDQQLLAKYDELQQSIFYQMFGDPVINNKKWSSKSVKTFLNDIVAGSSYGGEERQLNEGELGVLKVSAVTWGFFDSKEYKAVKKEVINKKIIIPKKGNLLFSRANTRELVGATCIVDDDYPYLFLPDKLWRVDLDSTKCNQYYFHLLLSIPEFKERLTKTATGTSGSMLNISMEKLKQLEIPLPPIELQNNFAGIVENIESQRKLTKETLQSSEFLFQSLLQKAFKGELVK